MADNKERRIAEGRVLVHFWSPTGTSFGPTEDEDADA